MISNVDAENIPKDLPFFDRTMKQIQERDEIIEHQKRRMAKQDVLLAKKDNLISNMDKLIDLMDRLISIQEDLISRIEQ